MAISVFQNFGFLIPKISKNWFFWEIDPVIQNFQNFQKTGIYVIQLLLVNQCAKFQVDSSIFDPQMTSFCFQTQTNLWRHFSNAICVTSRGRTWKQMTPLDSWGKAGQDRHHFCSYLSSSKFDLFTWPWSTLDRVWPGEDYFLHHPGDSKIDRLRKIANLCKKPQPIIWNGDGSGACAIATTPACSKKCTRKKSKRIITNADGSSACASEDTLG